MPVYLDSIKFTNPITGSDVDWCLANVGDELLIEHNISIKTYAISSTQTPLIGNNRDGYTQLGVQTGLDFSKFRVGDQVNYHDYSTGAASAGNPYTIVDKPDDTTIILNADLTATAPNSTIQVGVFSVVKPVTALNYQWNFIENSEATNFFSKVDGSEQLATITNLNPAGGGTNLPMTFLGQKSYQIGEILVDEVALSTTLIYTSKFKIKHYTRVTPIMLAAQWDDIISGIAPDYFLNLSCLKSIFYFEARYTLTDPNRVQTLLKDTILGNTGWYNENWNTKLTNYSFENLTFKDQFLNPIPAPILTVGNNTRFKFTLKNSIDLPFSDGNTKIVLNFAKAPNDATEYIANGRDMLHNFVWETIHLTVDSTPTPINGDNYGDSTLQSFYQVTAKYIDRETVEIEGKLDFLQDAIDVFNESNEPRFLLFLSVCDHTKNYNVSDRVTLLISAGSFYFQTVFPDLFEKGLPYVLPHFVDTYTTTSTYNQFTEDLNVIGVDFKPNASYLGNGNILKINRLSLKIRAYNTHTDENFLLDQISFNVANTPYVGDLQYFDIDQNSPIHAPINDIRKKIKCRYNVTTSKYEIFYPSFNRWEYWESLSNVNSAFFSTSQPNNGFNNDWARYANKFMGSDWVIRLSAFISIKYNDVPAIYESYDKDYQIFDRNLADYATLELKTQDPDTLTDLSSGGNYYFLGYKNTLVKAKFTVTGDVYNSGNTMVVIGMEVKEEGGRYGKRYLDSKHDAHSDSWFIPLDGETKVKLTFAGSGTIITGECLIDYTKLNLDKLNYKLSARLYKTVL